MRNDGNNDDVDTKTRAQHKIHIANASSEQKKKSEKYRITTNKK